MTSRPNTAPVGHQGRLAAPKPWEASSPAKGRHGRRIVLTEGSASCSRLPGIEPRAGRPATAPPGRPASPVPLPAPALGASPPPRRPVSRGGELLGGAALLGLQRLPVTPHAAPEEDMSWEEMQDLYCRLASKRPPGGVEEVGRWADAALFLLQHATQRQPAPHHLKTAFMCLLFESITAEFPQYSLMGWLKADLYRAIYEGFEEATSDGLGMLVAGGTLTARGALVPCGGRALPFIECATHFEAYRAAAMDLQRERQRRAAVADAAPARRWLVEESVRQFTGAVVRAHFHLWRRFVHHRQHLHCWVTMWQSVLGRQRLRLSLSVWRKWLVEQRFERMQRCQVETIALCEAEGKNCLEDLRQQHERLIRRQTALQLQLLVKRLDGIPDEEPQEDLGVMEVRVAALQEAIDVLVEERRAASFASDAARRALETCLDATEKMACIIVDTLITIPGKVPEEWGVPTPRGAATCLVRAAIDVEREPHIAPIAVSDVEEGGPEDTLPTSPASAHPEWLLLVWANTMLRRVGYPRTLYAFTYELCDGEKLALLLRACFPDAFPAGLEDEADPVARVKLVLGIAREIGLNPFLNPMEVLNCHAPSNLLFLAWIFDKFTAGNHCLLRQPDRLAALRDMSGVGTLEAAQGRVAELQALLDRMLRSESQWKAVRQHVTRHCMQVAARKVGAVEHPTLDIRQCRRKVEYNTVANDNLRALLAQSQDSVERQVLAVTKLLQRHQAEIESVHLYYVGIHSRFTKETMALFFEDCGMETKGFTLTTKLKRHAVFHPPVHRLAALRFERLCPPARGGVLSAEVCSVPPKDALKVYDTALPPQTPPSAGEDELADPGLGPQAFIVALIQLSEARFAGDEELTTPSTRLAAFLTRCVSRACHSDLAAYKAAVYQWQTQRMVAQHVPSVVKVFQQLANNPATEERCVARQTFLQLFADLDLVDGSLMAEDLCMCYAHAMVEEDLHEVCGMRLPEFVEGLVAAAFFRVPSPLLPPHVRFDTFMRHHFLPTVKRRFPEWDLL